MPATPQRLRMYGSDFVQQMREWNDKGRPPDENPWYLRDGVGSAVEVLEDTDEEKYLRIWRMDDLRNRPPARWLIEQVVEEKGLTVFFGPDKIGKTITISNILWAWAAGHDSWQGEETFAFLDPSPAEDGTPHERSVLYLLMEGQASFYQRYEAWCLANGHTEGLPNFYVADDSVALFSRDMDLTNPNTWPDACVRLWFSVDRLRPQILVIDTLSRATAGMDENSPQMASMVGFLDLLRNEFGVATVVVHHTALADGDRPRGHSSLKGAASSYVRVQGKPEDSYFTMVVGPHRNAAAVNQDLGANWHGWLLDKKETGNSFYVQLSIRAGHRETPYTMPKEATKTEVLAELLRNASEPMRWEDVYEEIYGPILDSASKSVVQRKLNKLAAGLPIRKKNGFWMWEE